MFNLRGTIKKFRSIGVLLVDMHSSTVRKAVSYEGTWDVLGMRK